MILIANFCECQVNKDKLQIGVKKRVENCPVKTKKGDFLHMHYKVYSIIVITVV